MPWLNHPSFKPVRNAVVAAFKKKTYVFRRLGHVIFLCGGAGSEKRDTLRDYLRRHHPKKLVFYADTIWEQLAGAQVNALEMEEQLAALADVVIIVVESPGTIAELGAFCLSDKLRRKLLPLNDIRFKADKSFINTGPIAWIDGTSAFAPCIYSDHTVILNAVPELEERLKRLPPDGKTTITNLAGSPKHLLFLLCDLAAVVGPAPVAHFEFYLKSILDASPRWNVETLLGLAAALGLLHYREVSGRALYFRLPVEDELEEYQHRRLFSLELERARVLSIMQSIPEAAGALRALAA